MATNANNNRRKVTLSEIAQAANVAKSTVSMVLNRRHSNIPISEATRQRVMEVAAALGYRPNSAARALAMGRTETILMVLFDQFDPPFFERLLGAESFLVPRGYTVSICTVTDEVGLNAFSRIIHSGKADGILLATSPSDQLQPLLRIMRDEIKNVGLPVVAMENVVPEWLRDCYVTTDDRAGAVHAVNHLIEHGHRRIALLSQKPSAVSELHSREIAYRNALQAAGITIDESLIIRCAPDGRDEEFGAVLQLARAQDFTALFAVTDAAAMVALSALKTACRRIPEDCAVVGFDDRRDLAGFLDPPLTTVSYPFFESGCASCELLLKLIEGKSAKPVVLPVSLVIRQSCGCKSEMLPDSFSDGLSIARPSAILK